MLQYKVWSKNAFPSNFESLEVEDMEEATSLHESIIRDSALNSN
jgi:hypothetical protein